MVLLPPTVVPRSPRRGSYEAACASHAASQAKDYVEQRLNPTLQRGLAALCRARPANPIEWLARWLLENKPHAALPTPTRRMPWEAAARALSPPSDELLVEESVWSVLREETHGHHPIRLMRLSHLRKARRWTRRQTTDETHFIGVDELERLPRTADGALPIYVVSHIWQSREDPDPNGTQQETLQRLFASVDVAEAGVFIDFCSFHQHDKHPDGTETRRTDDEQAAFVRGLKLCNVFFAHALVPVLVINNVRATHDDSTFVTRGWPWVEFRLACLLKASHSQLLACSLENELVDSLHAVEPAALVDEMATRKFTSELQASADGGTTRQEKHNQARMVQLYGEYHEKALAAVRALGYANLHDFHRQMRVGARGTS